MNRLSLRGSFCFAAAGLLAGVTQTSGCSSKSTAGPTGDASSSDAPATPLCAADEDLISDFTTDNGVRPVDGRQGGWYTYGDRSGLGLLMPAEGTGVMPDLTEGNPTCSKAGSLHVKAVGFTDWGAAMGVDIEPKVATDAGVVAKGTYNASRYKGIAFWAKAATPVKFAMVKFLDPYTEIPSVIPMDKWCDYKPMMPVNCSPYVVKFGNGYAGADLDAVAADYPKYKDFKIDTTWKRFEVDFVDAKQDRGNPGLKSPGDHLDVSQLMGLAIQVNSDHATTPPTANDFDIWVDDVAFVK